MPTAMAKPTATLAALQAAAPDDDVDDYMSMAIIEPPAPLEKETYTQRRNRKAREAEIRGRPKSKAELAADAAAARDAALSTSLPADSKGFKMMAKLGFKPGTALGKSDNKGARTEPLGVVVKEGRAGLGMEEERKRKIREELGGEEGTKRVKVDEGEYRERVGREREEKRLESLVFGAMKVAEGLDGKAEEGAEGGVNGHAAGRKGEDVDEAVSVGRISKPPTRQINVLWRGLVRQREEKERERRVRYDLHQSLSRSAAYEDPEEDKQDRQALGNEEEELEEEDLELDDFNALEPKERLSRLVEFLRARYHYCFWCKYRYPDDEMEGCPGSTEEVHD